MTVDLDIRLLIRKFVASRDKNLLLNQIDASDLFRDGMFNLKPGVHLEEIKVLVFVHEELNRSGRVVFATPSQCDSLLSHFLACQGIHYRAGRFFDDFLVPALNRTFALRHIDVVSMKITENLELNVSGRLNVLFYKNSSVSE